MVKILLFSDYELNNKKEFQLVKLLPVEENYLASHAGMAAAIY